MFEGIHHVHYVIRDRDEMVKFLDKNFGMKPDVVQDSIEGNNNPCAEALYNVGKTQLQFTQPFGTTSALAKYLAANGPGVYHVALAVDDVYGLVKKLKDNGIQVRGGKDGVGKSSRGGLTTNVDPADACGVWFQIAQDPK